MAGTPENRGKGDKPEDFSPFLSSEALVRPGSWDKLISWLAERVNYLPCMGWDGTFLRTISKMEPEDKERYLAQLPKDLLDGQEKKFKEWTGLMESHRELVEKMVTFWREDRQL